MSTARPQGRRHNLRRSTVCRSDRLKSFLNTDHNVRDTLDVVDRAYILHDGSIMMQGTPQQVIDNPDVKRVYLGDTFKS